MSAVQVLLLPLGTEWYAVELPAVREVVVAGPVEPLPGGPPAVLGVMNLRGEVLPVLDTPVLLGVPHAEVRGIAHVAVIEVARGAAGLTTTAQPHTAVLGERAGPSELGAGLGRFAVGDRVAALVDLEALLTPERVGAPA